MAQVKECFIVLRNDGFYKQLDFKRDDKHLAREEAKELFQGCKAEGIGCILLEGHVVEEFVE